MDEFYERIINEYLDRYIQKKISLEQLAEKVKEEENLDNAVRTIRYKLSDAILRVTGKKPNDIKLSDKAKEILEDNLDTYDTIKEFNYTGEKSITTKEDAIKFFNIDTDKENIYKSVFNSWDVSLKNKDGEVITKTNYQVKLFVQPKTSNIEEFGKKILEDIKNISTLPITIKRNHKSDDSHLLVLDPADIHIGKLCSSFEVGEDYNSQIAVKRVIEGVYGILDKAKGFGINKILFIGGNDILHVDTPKNTTTSGTFQDADGMWYNNFLLAKQLYIEVLTILLEYSDIEFVYNPSNHDYMSGFFLADVISTYFKGVDNINFNTSIAHRKYYTYYNNLIGTTHGDGAKINDLPLLMAHEAEDWSKCKHRYIYSHHVHHKISKDYIGVTFETLRSLSGDDSWHYKKGYVGTPKAIEGFIHHPEYGQIARLTHLF